MKKHTLIQILLLLTTLPLTLTGQGLTIRRSVEVSFPTQLGLNYQLQTSADLETWTNLGTPFHGTGDTIEHHIPAQDAKQFLRVTETSDPLLDSRDAIFQHATLGGLLVGLYEGDLTFGELLQQGNLGLGTFDDVDGELVVTDGVAYRIRVDGQVSPVEPTDRTPFAAVTFFEPDLVITIDSATDYASFRDQVDAQLPSLNQMYALRVRTPLTTLTTRSVPAQSQPFPPLADVVATQTTFDFANIRGDMVGFRLPTFVGAFNAAGFHFHFVDETRSHGGHVLEFSGEDIVVEVDVCRTLETNLPANQAFLDADLE